MTRVASWPVRPWRASRRCVPCTHGWRCGVRSLHQRPVRSSSSVAWAPTGSAVRTEARWRLPSAVLVTDVRACRSPAASSDSATRTDQPASSSVDVHRTLASPSVRTSHATRLGATALVVPPTRRSDTAGVPE